VEFPIGPFVMIPLAAVVRVVYRNMRERREVERQAALMRQQAAHDLQARQRHAVAQNYAVRHARFPVSDGL